MNKQDLKMGNFSILLCHPSKWVIDEMVATISGCKQGARILESADLTEAYNCVEHQEPDFVVVGAALASQPEFELFCALLHQTGVGCIVWDAANSHTETLGPRNIQHYRANSPPKNLCAMLSRTPDVVSNKVPTDVTPQEKAAFDPKRIIVIGASTGGVDALTKVLGHFSAYCPPTLIVQHTGGRFAPSLIRLLDRATSAVVRPAEENLALERGHIYLSSSDAVHMRLSDTARRTIVLEASNPVSGHRPSVDVLFHSAVQHARHVNAALLTGMGQDGARGLKALRDAGAHTIVQDKETSVVYGMPRVAAQMCAAIEQLPLEKIGPALLGQHNARAPA
jgi:two-component system chemotaxis response regulator CheB